MIREYLEKIQDELLEEKYELEKERVRLDNRIRENEKFAQLLDEGNDPNYESFTPRTVNSRNKEKIQELSEEHKKIQEHRVQNDLEIGGLLTRLDECQSIIMYEKERDDISKNMEEEDSVYKLKLLEAQEIERQRIARELHDSTVQDLTSTLHKIELSTKVMDADPQRCKQELSNVSENIRSIINRTREMIYNLRPMSLDDIGIDVTLERGIAKMERENNCSIEYIVIGTPFHVKSVVALSLLRIMQEACNNAIRHANSEEICVVLEYTKTDISLVIEDNGIGFNPSQKIQQEKNTGFGLSMMKERVHLLSGEIKLESTKERGTTISISIPNFIEEEEDE